LPSLIHPRDAQRDEELENRIIEDESKTDYGWGG